MSDERRYEIRIAWDTPHGASLELVGPDGMQPFAHRGQAQAEEMRKECIEQLSAPLIAAELRSVADMFEHAPDLYTAGELRARADQLDPSGATPGGEPHGG